MQAAYDDDVDDVESNGKVWLKRIAMALIALLVLGGIGYGIKSLMSGSDGPKKKQKTTIKLLPDTPPPPPPPPKEPPKEQPKLDVPKEVKVEQPKPEALPAEVLKMEGAAGDGPSPFAAGTVSNEYQGGEIGTKIGGAPNKQQFAWYTSLIKEQIEDAMAKDKALASGAYKLVVKVWVSANGKVQRHELVGSSGKAEVDVLVSRALDDMPALSEGPPGDMPQPIKLRVTARSVGLN